MRLPVFVQTRKSRGVSGYGLVPGQPLANNYMLLSPSSNTSIYQQQRALVNYDVALPIDALDRGEYVALPVSHRQRIHSAAASALAAAAAAPAPSTSLPAMSISPGEAPVNSAATSRHNSTQYSATSVRSSLDFENEALQEGVSQVTYCAAHLLNVARNQFDGISIVEVNTLSTTSTTVSPANNLNSQQQQQQQQRLVVQRGRSMGLRDLLVDRDNMRSPPSVARTPSIDSTARRAMPLRCISEPPAPVHYDRALPAQTSSNYSATLGGAGKIYDDTRRYAQRPIIGYGTHHCCACARTEFSYSLGFIPSSKEIVPSDNELRTRTVN
jgi:hypothetical protein